LPPPSSFRASRRERGGGFRHRAQGPFGAVSPITMQLRPTLFLLCASESTIPAILMGRVIRAGAGNTQRRINRIPNRHQDQQCCAAPLHIKQARLLYTQCLGWHTTISTPAPAPPRSKIIFNLARGFRQRLYCPTNSPLAGTQPAPHCPEVSGRLKPWTDITPLHNAVQKQTVASADSAAARLFTGRCETQHSAFHRCVHAQ